MNQTCHIPQKRADATSVDGAVVRWGNANNPTGGKSRHVAGGCLSHARCPRCRAMLVRSYAWGSRQARETGAKGRSSTPEYEKRVENQSWIAGAASTKLWRQIETAKKEVQKKEEQLSQYLCSEGTIATTAAAVLIVASAHLKHGVQNFHGDR